MKKQIQNKYYSYIMDCGYNINITAQSNNTAYLYLLKDGIRVENIKVEFTSNWKSSTWLEAKAQFAREHTRLSNALGMLVKEMLVLQNIIIKEI